MTDTDQCTTYEALPNSLETYETVLIVRAVHSNHGVRLFGFRPPNAVELAMEVACNPLYIEGGARKETGQPACLR